VCELLGHSIPLSQEVAPLLPGTGLAPLRQLGLQGQFLLFGDGLSPSLPHHSLRPDSLWEGGRRNLGINSETGLLDGPRLQGPLLECGNPPPFQGGLQAWHDQGVLHASYLVALCIGCSPCLDSHLHTFVQV
jgi:hypothetical protein